MDTQDIRLDKTDRILTVTLNRPDKLNVFTRAMRDELIAAFKRADEDDDVRVVSPDVAEGIASFKEKRAPRFTMRPSRDMPDFYPWWEERPFK